MTPKELATLEVFREGERDIAGRPLDWSQANYQTMWWLVELRRRLDSPIIIIRLAHPDKPTAVDWCCPGRSYQDVVMETMRLPLCSYGFYSGNSVHIDLRSYQHLPARWLAIKHREMNLLKERGLGALVSGTTEEWTYLQWDWRCLQFVIELAQAKPAQTLDV
jgi:hypothetical protein